MKSELNISKLLVKKSPIHGYGVFADQDIQPDAIIEESYVLLANPCDRSLWNYTFGCEQNSYLALGFGSIYNHSEAPNANHECDATRLLVTFRANRLIRRGEEICISYGRDWFSSRQLRPRTLHSLAMRRFTHLLLRFSLVAVTMCAVIIVMRLVSFKPF